MKYLKHFVAALALFALASVSYAQTRHVDGYELDDNKPGLKMPKIYNLAQLTSGDGAIPAASNALGVTKAESGIGPIHSTTWTIAATVAMTDAGAAGCHGALQLYDFPAGNLMILGSTSNLALTAGAGGITDSAALVSSVGTVTVGTGDATLTTTEADFIASTSSTLTGGVGAMLGKSATANIVVFDGTSTSKDAFLNFAVPDAGSTASDTLAIAGTVTIAWVQLGDN